MVFHFGQELAEVWWKFGSGIEIFDVFLKVLVVFETFAPRAWNPNWKNTTCWTHYVPELQVDLTTHLLFDLNGKTWIAISAEAQQISGRKNWDCDNLEPSIQGCAILCECASITDAFAAVADCLFGCWIANLSSEFTTLITMDWNIMLYKRGKSKSFLLQKYPAYQRKTWKKFAATELTVCAKIALKPTALLIHFFNINKIDLRKRVYLAIASY